MKKKFDFSKVLLGFLVTMLVVFVIGGVLITIEMANGTKGNEHMMAKVRYFDGSIDTVSVDRYWTSDGMIKVVTKDGFELTGSAQNITLIKEPEGWDQ